MEKLPITLRKANEEDAGFIFNSWLKCYRKANAVKPITNPIYFQEQHKIIESLVLDDRNFTIMACNPDDPSQIYGFVCAGYYEGIFTLHWIYVKQSFRNLRIGSTLLNAFEHDFGTAAVYTHHNHISSKLAPKYNMLYHPYILVNYKESKNVGSKESSPEVITGTAESRSRLGIDDEEKIEIVHKEPINQPID